MGAEQQNKGDSVRKIPGMLDLANTNSNRVIILPKDTDPADVSECRALIATLVDADATQEEIAKAEELLRTVLDVRDRVSLMAALTDSAKGDAEREQSEEDKLEEAREAFVRVGQRINFKKRDVYDVTFGFPTADSSRKQVFISSEKVPSVLLLDDEALARDLQAVIDAKLVPCHRAVKTNAAFEGLDVKGIPMLGNIDGEEIPFILVPTNVGGSIMDFSIILLPKAKGCDATQAARTTFGGQMRVRWLDNEDATNDPASL